jgi:chromosome segregation ATPase
MDGNEQIQDLKDEVDRLKRSRDRWLSDHQALERDLEELKSRYNELHERFKQLEQENWSLRHDLEYYQVRAKNWQQQAETLQDEKRRGNLSENF